MLNKYSIALGCLIVLAFANTNGALTWAGNQLISPLAPGQDDMAYARRMSDTIMDTPACARFKQAILQAGKGAPGAAATKVAIINAYDEAKKNGCRKP